MHDDAKALVDGLLGWNAQDARELVAKRTGAVGLDVGGGQREADPAPRQERPERVLLARRDRLRAGALVAWRSPSAASRASSSVEVCRISRCSGVAAASSRTLTSASASARLCPSGRCNTAESLSSSR